MHRRLLTGALVAIALLVATPRAAWGHVEIEPGEVPKGSSAVPAVTVPDERDDASTVKVDVNVPTDRPIAQVTPTPKAGWTFETRTSPLPTPITVDGRQVTEVVSEVIWSAATTGRDQDERFEMSVGPLPSDVDQLEFRTLQTYSDGQEAAWIEPTPPGDEEPEHPAPVLKLSGPIVPTSAPATTASVGPTAPTPPSADGNAAGSTGPTVARAPDPDPDKNSDGSTTAIVLVVIGVVVVGGVAAAGFVRRRRAAGPPA